MLESRGLYLVEFRLERQKDILVKWKYSLKTFPLIKNWVELINFEVPTDKFTSNSIRLIKS